MQADPPSRCSLQACGAPIDAGACNVDTCPSGCCDSSGRCEQGLTSTECGQSGAVCQNCLQTGESCVDQTCVAAGDGGGDCSFGCPGGGCCDPANGCVLDRSDTACGLDGARCFDCTQFGAACDPQSNECRTPGGAILCAQTCDGCCDPLGNCQTGFADVACGESGARCQDCTALQPASTCDAKAAPRLCASQETQCPAPYAGCPAVLEELAPAAAHVCSSGELRAAAAACSGGPDADACDSYFAFESSSNPACARCLQLFDVDFETQSGIRACAAPYVDATCNHNSGCIVDCLRESCFGCADDASTSQCDTQGLSGTCAAYRQSDNCVTQALSGAAALCNPTTYQGNFGAWLEAVGARYCGQ